MKIIVQTLLYPSISYLLQKCKLFKLSCFMNYYIFFVFAELLYLLG